LSLQKDCAKKSGIGPEGTRKAVHNLTAFWSLPRRLCCTPFGRSVILGSAFAAIDFFAVRHHLLSGLHNTSRLTYGTVFYPISLSCWRFCCGTTTN
jgi:hypothetical protein